MEKFIFAFFMVFFMPWSFYSFLKYPLVVVRATEVDGECVADEANKQDLNISVYVLKNSTGDWISSFYAEKGIGDSTDGVNLQLKQSVVRCGERNVVRIRGIVRDVLAESYLDKIKPELEKKDVPGVSTNKTTDDIVINSEKLRFHEKRGNNAVLTNDGRTAYRNNPSSDGKHGTVTTNRPLNNDELFEVKLEKTVTDTGTFVFGVTSTLPTDIESRYHSFDTLKDTWVVGFREVKYEGAVIKDNYGVDVSKIKVGERIGVVRRKNGDLHFYFNGVDLGVAASNLPSSVYGLLDIINYAVQFSIV